MRIQDFLLSLLIGIFLFIWVIKFVGWPEIKQAFLVFTGWQGIAILFVSLLLEISDLFFVKPTGPCPGIGAD